MGFAAGDSNLYRYVGNNPTNVTDPTGLQRIVDPTDPFNRRQYENVVTRRLRAPYKARVDLYCYDNSIQRDLWVSAFQQAAPQLEATLKVLEDDTEFKLLKTINDNTRPNGRLEIRVLFLKPGNRTFYVTRLRKAVALLKDQSTRVRLRYDPKATIDARAYVRAYAFWELPNTIWTTPKAWITEKMTRPAKASGELVQSAYHEIGRLYRISGYDEDVGRDSTDSIDRWDSLIGFISAQYPNIRKAQLKNK
jgi:hypothetical protein